MVQLSYYHFLLTITLAQSGIAMEVVSDDLRRLNSFLWGVYKLTALRRPGGAWRPKVKISEQTAKVSTPGVLQIRRYRQGGRFVADMTYDLSLGAGDGATVVDPADPTRIKRVPPGARSEDLLVAVVRGGRVVYEEPGIERARERARDQLRHLHPTVLRFLNPHEYPAGLERRLHELRTRLILDARGHAANAARVGLDHREEDHP